jgi:hypothetical protein
VFLVSDDAEELLAVACGDSAVLDSDRLGPGQPRDWLIASRIVDQYGIVRFDNHQHIAALFSFPRSLENGRTLTCHHACAVMHRLAWARVRI